MLAIAVIFFLLAGFTYVSAAKTTPIVPMQLAKQMLSITKAPITTPVPNSKYSWDVPTLSINQTKQNIKISPLPTAETITTKSTPLPQPANTTLTEPTTTPGSAETVTLQIHEPDGDSTITLTYHDGSNPCSLLSDAKSDGKIKSVTINHYGAPLNSDYVKEINGFTDNWNFSLNGETKPTGCSNYTISKGNSIVWTYK